MILSDRDIRRALKRDQDCDRLPHHDPLVIDPLDLSRIQPSSVDLTLADEFRVYPFKLGRNDIDLDDAKKVETELLHLETYYLYPNEFILASTVEWVEIPDDMAARVEGKSSLGRLGLLIHLTAGYVDPGFRGKITLEMKNVNNRPIILRAGKPICQLSLIKLTSAAEHPYGHESRNSKYQDQERVQGSLYDGR